MTDGILIAKFTDENFPQEVGKAENQLVLVDFWASWCGPCKIIEPVIEEIAKEYEKDNRVKIGKVNVDESGQMAEKYEVRSLPTIKFFFDGKVIAESIGAVPKEEITQKIEAGLEQIKK